MKRLLAAAIAAALLGAAGCAGPGSGADLLRQTTAARRSARTPSVTALLHASVGFSIDTPARAATASQQGMTSTILYVSSPAPGSALANALQAHGISVIDGGISSVLSSWECHRTHTVAPPPASYAHDSYCAKDYDPSMTTAAALRHIENLLNRDAKRPSVVGYWVLDDWPWWDAGSARGLLQRIRAQIERVTPGRPAICGFAGGIGAGKKYWWEPTTAANYSNTGCDMVGWYVYSPFGRTHPSNGDRLNWSMTGLLAAMARSLGRYGWSAANAPLMGIGQAWSGPLGAHDYQPGLSAAQMQTQAAAFCSFGASSISWYAWDDSGYVARTQTPMNAPAISQGIADGLRACRSTWARRR